MSARSRCARSCRRAATIAAIRSRRSTGTHEALADYDKVLSLRPRHVGALNRRGNTLGALKRPEEALAAYDAALAIEPDNVDALNNRSVVLVTLGRSMKPCRAASARLRCGRPMPTRSIIAAMRLRALERFEEARASYAAVLALEPRRADALNNLGLALMRLERPAEALDELRRGARVDPNDLGALHNRANALAEPGAFEEALASLRRSPGERIRSCRRAQYPRRRAQRTAPVCEALASYDAALAAAPDRVDIEVNRGTALLDLNRYDEALASFDKVLARDPENIAALINRGNAFIKDKRFADALDSYDKALAIVPDHVGALTDRGVALAEMDRFDEALAAHERALRVEPHVVAAHVNRGNALLKLTRMEEALASYAEALSLDPEHATPISTQRSPGCASATFARLEAIRMPLEEKELQRSVANIPSRCGAARRI